MIYCTDLSAANLGECSNHLEDGVALPRTQVIRLQHRVIKYISYPVQ